MFDDLSKIENSTEDNQKTSEAKNEPSRWLSKWSHVFAGLAFCLLYFPFQDYPWSFYLAVAGSYSVFSFAISLGLGLNSSDDFFGDPLGRIDI